MGHVPRFVAGGLRREGRAGRAGVEEILLSTHAHVSRGSDRETFELQHARTTRIERFDLRLLLVWRKREHLFLFLFLFFFLFRAGARARVCISSSSVIIILYIVNVLLLMGLLFAPDFETRSNDGKRHRRRYNPRRCV